MKVLVINNEGGGFADYTEVAEGTTVAQLFERQIGAKNASNYLIRVNRQTHGTETIRRRFNRIPTKSEAVRCMVCLRGRGRDGAES